MPGRKSDGDKKELSPLVKASIFGALGFEFVAVTVGSLMIGTMVDERFDVGPLGTVGCLALGMLGAAWHVFLLTKRFLIDEGE